MIYYFTAPWCVPCQKTKPLVLELDTDGIFEIIDVDADPEMVAKFKIRSVPTFIGVDPEGNEMFRTVGAQSKNDLIKMIEDVSK